MAPVSEILQKDAAAIVCPPVVDQELHALDPVDDHVDVPGSARTDFDVPDPEELVVAFCIFPLQKADKLPVVLQLPEGAFGLDGAMNFSFIRTPPCNSRNYYHGNKLIVDKGGDL